MMKTATKVLAAMTSCALCAAMAGGAAYAIAPEEAQAQASTTTEAAKAEATESVTAGYAANASLLNLAGLSENGEQVKAEAPAAAPETEAVEAEAIEAPPEAPAAETATAAEAPASYEPAPQALYPMSLEIAGQVIPYIDYYGAGTAPTTTGGLWMGSDSTTDGSWGYFIGHHPGCFNDVMNLTYGDQVSVCDRNGNTATYTVFDVYNVPNTTYWEDIEAQITGHGESIVLQTCVGDGHTYRIVQAK